MRQSRRADMIVPLALPMSGVAAWLARADAETARLTWLDEAERRRAARLPDAAAERYIAARCTIRRIVAAQLGTRPTLRIDYDHGRPCLPEHPGTGISITYSGAWLAVALADGPVGVDCERIVGGAGSRQPDEVRAFYTRWTIAEASFKARGDASPFDPADLPVRHAAEPDRWGIVGLPIVSPVVGLALAIATSA